MGLLTNRTIVPHLYGKTRYTLFSHPSKHTNNYPPNKRWNVLYQYIHARELSLFPIKEVKTDRLFLPESGAIRLPFGSLPGLGEAAAQKLQEAREEGEFLSIEELKQRTGISKAVVEILESGGVLEGLSETNQIRLF